MNNKKIIIIILILIFIAVLIFCECIRSNNFLTVNNYVIKNNELKNPVRFAFISDLHNKEFGEDNCDLVNLIAEQQPDFIAVGGDMITRTYENNDNMKTILTQIAKIAPVYCCLGNHESDLSYIFDFKSDIENCGATLLDNEHTTITTKNGEEILIIGMSGYPYPDTDEKHFWDELQDSDVLSADNYSLLLIHAPDYLYGLLPDSGIDLTMCGHTHGGLVQIPFIGGLIAPNQMFFPEYDKGLFEFGESTMIISAGLANSYPVPRFNNPPEICVVELQPE